MMQSIVLLAQLSIADAQTPKQDTPSSGTCANKCGETYGSNSCHCNKTCIYFGDCCHDYEQLCNGVVRSLETLEKCSVTVEGDCTDNIKKWEKNWKPSGVQETVHDFLPHIKEEEIKKVKVTGGAQCRVEVKNISTGESITVTQHKKFDRCDEEPLPFEAGKHFLSVRTIPECQRGFTLNWTADPSTMSPPATRPHIKTPEACEEECNSTGKDCHFFSFSADKKTCTFYKEEHFNEEYFNAEKTEKRNDVSGVQNCKTLECSSHKEENDCNNGKFCRYDGVSSSCVEKALNIGESGCTDNDKACISGLTCDDNKCQKTVLGAYETGCDTEAATKKCSAELTCYKYKDMCIIPCFNEGESHNLEKGNYTLKARIASAPACRKLCVGEEETECEGFTWHEKTHYCFLYKKLGAFKKVTNGLKTVSGRRICGNEKPQKTQDGLQCLFPFRIEDGGEENHKCVKTSSRFWCATSTTETGTYSKWDWCR